MSDPASSEPVGEPSLFDAIGGAPKVSQLVDRFYALMDELPPARTIRAMHGADLVPVGRVLKLYLTEWLGGDPGYSAERGHPRLRQRHLHVPITSAERDAWLLCMDMALAECVADAAIRTQIFHQLVRLADWMRNQPDPG